MKSMKLTAILASNATFPRVDVQTMKFVIGLIRDVTFFFFPMTIWENLSFVL